ncbi:ABC transporter permease [Microbacterium sp. EYE_5]|uniref:ABC transporter permease n=1 Tax=unclassified Microbacterium TaxID=2609290 RepID=UPI002003AC44|nr:MULTISPECIES: ABC transporter permease [unclassified Microbacterium]MCK6079288.1 ABC transporter permease [Microbacterium sp. EYE_382]MCK6084558.1 ABC transporter permease [Microbacterium sp. EYE_384]MCK6123213.1 ABC transporter permease [Microbacterium sp. EYE_80]MCK6125322.1 ABC transporter permease [Microbacterium sp. EYE_79]MCK6140242.1 ABC transporter permease [Microbacterium sp. EYE_39]
MTTTTAPQQQRSPQSPQKRTFLGRDVDVLSIVLEGRAFIALIVLIIIFALLSDSFLTLNNLVIMTKHVAYNAILAIGMLFVILKGGIDLSVGSTVGLAGVVAGTLLQGWQLTLFDIVVYPQVWFVVIIALAVGTLVGFINGVLVTKFHVAPFIATLGMLYVARGAALLISNGTTYPRLGGREDLGNQGFLVLGGNLLGIPTAIWIMVVFALVASFVLRKTPFGRWVYASGGNERAAALSGVPVRKVNLRVYMISGFCAATTGLILSSQLTSAAPQLGETFELNAIAAVVIGGAALTGGRGNVRGVLIGAFVIGFLSDGLVLVGVSTFWQIAIKGAVIILAVMLDQAQQRIKRSKNAALAAANKNTPDAGAPAPTSGTTT